MKIPSNVRVNALARTRNVEKELYSLRCYLEDSAVPHDEATASAVVASVIEAIDKIRSVSQVLARSNGNCPHPWGCLRRESPDEPVTCGLCLEALR